MIRPRTYSLVEAGKLRRSLLTDLSRSSLFPNHFSYIHRQTRGWITEAHSRNNYRSSTVLKSGILSLEKSSNKGLRYHTDPTQLWYADPTNPQSLNLYGYGWNNPHKCIDNGNEVVLALVGAGVGFATGFVGEWIHDHLSRKGFSWRDSLSYGAGGAATGVFSREAEPFCRCTTSRLLSIRNTH